jgi:polyisoprenoid-binding protein YceI
MKRLSLVMVLSAVGCSKKEEPAPQPATTSLAPSKAEPSASIVKMKLDAKSKASIDMPAPQEHIKAEATNVTGTLDVDPTDLTKSRGEIKVDLTTLTTKTFSDQEKNESQTTHARTWLQVVVEGKTNEEMRWASFAIRSVDGVAEKDLSKVPAEGDVRKVKMTLRGELLIHGHKKETEAKVEVAFKGDKPDSLEVKTALPMRVVLKDFDVKPRDNFGAIAQKAFGLLGTKVAETADISLEMRAAP